LDKETKDPRDLIPYDQLLVDEELCDYCGLCVPLCPEEAITVEGEPLDVKLDFKGTIDVDQSLCIGCGKCYLVCPYEAMDVTKPFQGEIRLVEGNLVKCDPLGCHGCFNVCPAQCWYVDERGKAAMVKDQCILCGACAMACHCRAIEVERSKVSHTPIKETPWASEWKDAISSILTKRKRRPDVSMAVSPPAYERPKPGCVEIPLRDPELLKLVEERLADLEPLLEKTKVRFILEREPPEEAAKKILARMKKSEKSGTGGEDGG
jgi:4Fe-4S ferredoxin